MVGVLSAVKTFVSVHVITCTLLISKKAIDKHRCRRRTSQTPQTSPLLNFLTTLLDSQTTRSTTWNSDKSKRRVCWLKKRKEWILAEMSLKCPFARNLLDGRKKLFKYNRQLKKHLSHASWIQQIQNFHVQGAKVYLQWRSILIYANRRNLQFVIHLL